MSSIKNIDCSLLQMPLVPSVSEVNVSWWKNALVLKLNVTELQVF